MPPLNCRYCSSRSVVRRGRRRTRLGSRQILFCKDCGRRFTDTPMVSVTYPPWMFLAATQWYCGGLTIEGIRAKFRRLGAPAPCSGTVSGWIRRFSGFAGMLRYRAEIKKEHRPLIRRRMFKHRQNYLFQVHEFKLALAGETPAGLTDYLHSLFDGERLVHADRFPVRPSVLASRPLAVNADSLHSYASNVASLALRTAENNYQRHALLQRFFLSTDTATVATEVPVYMTEAENSRITGGQGAVLGHIDFLQVFGNTVTILDYKPGARGDKKAAAQVFWYALALSLRTGVHLKHIRCAWFDENDYFIFPAIKGYYAARETVFPRLSGLETPPHTSASE